MLRPQHQGIKHSALLKKLMPKKKFTPQGPNHNPEHIFPM
jgi:hypothetical protein